MDYQLTFTVPANTAEADAISHTMEIAPGLINLVWMKGRPGAAGLPKVRIYWGQKQLYPASPDEWYSIDWAPIAFAERFVIHDFPFELTVKTYNLDRDNEHKVIVRVNIWPLDLFRPRTTVAVTVENPWPELGD